MRKLFKRMFNPDSKNEIPNDQNMIDFLILNNALEVAGIDSKTGEMLYSFTPKLKEIMPELYKQHINHVNTEIMHLWENGFVNVNLLEDNPLVTLTPKAFDTEAISRLPEQARWGLEEMKRLMKKRNF